MFRLKTLFGNELSARLLDPQTVQTTQALIHCTALNNEYASKLQGGISVHFDKRIASTFGFLHQRPKELIG